MTAMKKNRLKTIITYFAVIIPFVTGGATFGWCKIIVPEIKKIHNKENNDLVKLTKQLLDATEFQNFLIFDGKTVEEIKKAKEQWEQFKVEIEKGKDN